MPSKSCQCPNEGVLNPGSGFLYNSETELPFVKHEPGQCKCTNDLKDYIRDGKILTLCSCCCLSTDKPKD